VIRGKNGIDLPTKQREEIANFETVPPRRIGRKIFLRQSEESRCRVEPTPILRMSWPPILLLQMDKAARRLNKPLEVIGVLRPGAQPEVLQDIVRFVITLLVPATKKTEITGVLCNFIRGRSHRPTAKLLDQPGNSLAFIHFKLNLESAEMTGNRGRVFFEASVLRSRSARDG
jgi:hypothetical protein